MTLHLGSGGSGDGGGNDRGKKGGKNGSVKKRKGYFAAPNHAFRPSAWMRWRGGHHWCLPAINLGAGGVPELLGPCALTDVGIIELSISPNYQSCIKIIHLLVDIKHIMSLQCVLRRSG